MTTPRIHCKCTQRSAGLAYIEISVPRVVYHFKAHNVEDAATEGTRTISAHSSFSFSQNHSQQVVECHRQSQVDKALKKRISRFRRERHDIMLGDGVDQGEYAESGKHLLDDIHRPHTVT